MFTKYINHFKLNKVRERNNHWLIKILLLWVFASTILIGCVTIEPMVKNKYDLIRGVDIHKTEPIEKVAILAEISNWAEKDVFSGVSKSNEEREEDRSVAEVAFKGAIKKILNSKGYECIYMDGQLNQAFKKAYDDGCQALLHAKFKWTKSRLYYGQDYYATYTKIWYAEDVSMANGYFDIKDVKTKSSIFMVKYAGHSNVSGTGKPYERRLLGHEALVGEKEIPYIYRLVEESLKEFPTIDKLFK